MKKTITILALTSILAASALCQTYGAAAFVQRGHSYAVGIVPVFNQFHKGKVSLDVNGLLGVEAGTPTGVFGTAEIASYDLGHGWKLFGGVGTTVPFTNLKLSAVNANNVGLVIGFLGPIDLSVLGIK